MLKNMRYVISFLLLLALIPALTGGELTIISTNDIHGNVNFLRTAYAIEKLQESEKKSGRDVLLIDCGDLTFGSFETTFDSGSSFIKALNELDYDVFVPGNHEWEWGGNVLKSNIATFRGASLYGTWKLIEKNGLRIAVIGCPPPFPGIWYSPEQVQGFTAPHPSEVLKKAMPAIRKAQAGLVILATHSGEYTSGRAEPEAKYRSLSGLLEEYPEVSLVLAAHSHQEHPGKRLYGGAWYVQGPEHGSGYAEIRITFDDETKRITNIESQLYYTAATAPESEKVRAVLKNCIQYAEKKRNERVAEKVAADRLNTTEAVAGFLAQALAEKAGTDIAVCSAMNKFTHAGGILTEFDLYLLAPYENYLVTLELSPGEMRAMLEEGLRLNNWKSAVCGLRYETDEKKRCIKGELFLSDGTVWNKETDRKRIAFSSYDVNGRSNHLPGWRKIAEKASSKRDYRNTHLRESIREKLKKTR